MTPAHFNHPMDIEYVPAKTIVTRTKSPEWFDIDYTMNIYRGCSHGCIYCDSRSECYGVHDFDTVRVKADALEIIAAELSGRRRKGVVATGAMSDPYNPLERGLGLTRQALLLLRRYRFGASVATKSPLIVRDADVLRDIAGHSPVIVKITITTPDDDLAARIEPNVARSGDRFRAIRQLADRGIFVGVLLMPVLPFVTDEVSRLRRLVRLAADSGAKFIYTGLGVTLRNNQREHYYQMLDGLFPGLSAKYHVRYGERYGYAVPGAVRLGREIERACEDAGLLCRMEDIVRAYRAGYESKQLRLF